MPRVFLDTNIFVYAIDPRDRRKQALARSLIRNHIQGRSAAISYQVVQELLNLATTKFAKAITAVDAQAFLDLCLWPICEVFPDLALYLDALTVRAETGWRFYDSLVVSAASRASCAILLSEDLQAGRVVRGVEIRNPFA